MAMIRIQPAPFFASKNRAFWNLQLAGWGGAFLLRALSALANGLPLDLLAVILVNTLTGFSITLVLSVIYRQLINRKPIVTWGGTALVLLAAVIFHATIDAWVQGIYYGGSRETTFAQRFIGITYIPLTLLGAWSALYFAINYFLTVEQQADRLQRLEAQTTAAQLAMLRYQLNPHFLFNTLNSISTLVLLKQTGQANAMLTRLSGFLRHTLIAEPGSQVTLAQEVETLQLYLEIERMRFEDRLRTHFELEEAALEACLPSMLLQPLVENAIKYAVSPQEEGARISVTARVVGERLRVTVEDTGPGVDGPIHENLFDNASTTQGQPVSTGVGLANIRNRLMQAYGEDQVFETRSEPGGGFTVLIEIPYERASESASEPEPGREAAAPPAAAASDNAERADPAGASATVIPLNPPRTMGSSA
ncbi:sensor histidine kinase [Erythrobacter sp. JK5]|uniref:sensor histidine kinase n=1 Tax=Erythrobacter sp. JK5 TaxID=2829500 RepID=UPI001BAC358B|nr:sensor histidine kinase [Erythrobacter sp. JK5]QUL37211.1 sensor histidine kinase [Erythrobacter sp. JK5]